MLYSIKYVYVNALNGSLVYLSEKENEALIASGKLDKNSVLGAKVMYFNGREVASREIYVGNKLMVEDICNNKYNAEVLNVRFLNVFLEKAKRYNVSTIIQFPQINRINCDELKNKKLVEWHFLEGDEVVIPWDSHESVYEKLESSLEPFKKMATGFENSKFVKTSNKYTRERKLTLHRHVSSR